ncbi:protein YgfX [Pseudomonas knackmussii]|uniref:protein YgfX n=1 Tax=Pseudomonas knackmussii TaxID=65741 RepID=UPI00136276E7|nr:protein YgfX [Pseudomonas knackmussii]
MSSRIDPFECRWRPSTWLLAAYLACLALAIAALLLAAIPPLWQILGLLLCLSHALWALPRQILLRSPQSFGALRHDNEGWQLWCPRQGWSPVQLCADSLALPSLIVLRFRLPGSLITRGLCLPADSLAPDEHRRLRLRLRFSRDRWAAPE